MWHALPALSEGVQANNLSGALARSSVSSDIPFSSTHSVRVIYHATKKTAVRVLPLWHYNPIVLNLQPRHSLSAKIN